MGGLGGFGGLRSFGHWVDTGLICGEPREWLWGRMRRSISVIAIVRHTLEVYVAQAPLLLPLAVCLAGLLRILDVMPAKHSGVLALLILLAILFAVTLFTGVVVQIVADARNGRSVVSLRAALRAVRPVLASLLLVGVVAGIAITLLSFVGPLITLSLLVGAALGGGGHLAYGFAHLGGILVIGLAANVFLVLAVCYLILSWSIAAPVVVLERPHGLGALARSRALVRYNRWRIFGTLLLFGIPLGVVGRLVEMGGVSAGKVPAVASEILVTTLILPVPLIVVAVIYFELLIVNGGHHDIDCLHGVEELHWAGASIGGLNVLSLSASTQV
jgi:hypothetical protein